MAVQLDANGKDDLKTQFVTREGTYRLMTLSEYSRPNRGVGYQTNQNNPQVRVSLVSLPNPNSNYQQDSTISSTQSQPSTSSSSSTAVTTAAAAAAIINNNNNNNNNNANNNNNNSNNNNSIGNSTAAEILANQQQLQGIANGGGDRICFNFGKEIYVYAFRGIKMQTPDMSKPIDKKLYKGTNPCCHDFNAAADFSDNAPLLVGFTTGQIQLVIPGKREPGKLYNEERLIDKTKVTCLKWLPKSTNLFLASHASGHLYVYNEELSCTPTTPNYQQYKIGDGYTILTCKSKTTRNPVYKWTFGTENCSINEFCFSPCGTMLAIVSQDGFLRVFQYNKMELLGVARSYFGGFLCVCWSPDGKYIVVGGEDDLVTVWSLNERRVVARGQGHRSWVSVVAFDPYTSFSQWDGTDFSDDENPIENYHRCYNHNNNINNNNNNNNNNNSNDVDLESIPINGNNNNNNNNNTINNSKRSTSIRDSNSIIPDKLSTSYRLGSVSQDTQLCLWDITEDILRQSYDIRHRLSSYDSQQQQQPRHHLQLNVNGADGNSRDTIDSSGNNKNSGNTNNNINDNNNLNNNNVNNISNKIGNKFSTMNCIGGGGGGGGGSVSDSGRNTINENNSSKHNSSKFFINNNINNNNNNNNSSGNKSIINYNCVSSNSGHNLSKGDSTPSDGGKSTSSSSKSSESGLTAFNTLTQRLSNFGFGTGGGGGGGGSGDKKSFNDNHQYQNHVHHGNKKSFTFLKSSRNNNNNHSNFIHTNSINYSNNTLDSSGTSTSTKNSKSLAAATTNSIVSTYDPMKLIGTSICPRFDECPLLEPLVCKKIAHERLTALIFREDCFLTACQDGFIYTWARPGSMNVTQHLSPSPSAPPPSGTVV